MAGMTLRFSASRIPHHCWPLAGVAALAPALGCGPGDVDQGFRVTNIAFDGDRTLTLTFSQPIANADAIDPNDFRISFARTFSSTYTDPESGQTYTEQYTGYNDLAFFIDYYGGTPRFSFAAATLGGSDTQLVLEAAAEGIAAVCMYMGYYEDYFEQYEMEGLSVDMALFIHYAGGDIPLESEGGEVLADIGPDWVLTEQPYLSRMSYGFTQLVPQLRIPCP